jgi:hypothetical protein
VVKKLEVWQATKTRRCVVDARDFVLVLVYMKGRTGLGVSSLGRIAVAVEMEYLE